MTSTSRSLQHSWNTAWATAPPAACSTLRNLNNEVAWGQTCVFGEEDGEEDGGALPFSINTACMPWVTSNIYPSPSAFYSPATACPESWTAVATQTTASSSNDGDRWIDGETALQCCPDGFDGDGGSGCRPGSGGSWPVVECGEADAEENELRTYSGGSWPASVTASITALQLRYQASDVGSASSTSGAPESTGGGVAGGGGNSEGGSGNGSGGGGGLSTGATAAIATVIPLAFIVGALAAFMLWRRRKQKRAAFAASNHLGDEKPGRPSGSVDTAALHPTTHGSIAKGTSGAAVVGTAARTGQHETPEWNVEMDATEAERQKLVGAYHAPMSASTPGTESEAAAELGGMVRVPRKPIAPVEIDSNPVLPEVGDAYIPYRPERGGD